MNRLHRGHRGLLVCAIVAVVVLPLRGQEEKTPAVPAWRWMPTPHECVALSDTANRLEQALFVLGNPTETTATAFCISRKHRLLVTAAHAVDPKFTKGFTAIMAGTGWKYDVRWIWRHPDTVKGDPWSADVAVLQLAPGGHDLPAEFLLTRPKQGDRLIGHSVGTTGFPGYSQIVWPARGEKPRGQDGWGVISDVTAMNPGVSGKTPPWRVDFTARSWGGASGSPIFLRDGSIIGVHTSISLRTHHDSSCSVLSHGILADAVWDILTAGEHLRGLLDPEDGRVLGKDPPPNRTRQPIPESAPSPEAFNRLVEAQSLQLSARHEESHQICDALIREYPWWSAPYTCRGFTFLARREHEKAWVDLVLTLRLNPGDPASHLSVASALTAYSVNTRNPVYAEGARAHIESLLHLGPPKMWEESFSRQLTNSASIVQLLRSSASPKVPPRPVYYKKCPRRR